MRFEPIFENDFHNLHELQPARWPNIIANIRYYINKPFCRPIKVYTASKILGIGTVIFFGKTAWLAHIIVHPEFRRKGIGFKIVTELLEIVKTAGCEAVSLIATELGFPVYKRAGFKEQTEYVFLEREGPLEAICDSVKIIKYEDRHKKDLLSLDRVVSGEERGELLNEINKLLCLPYRWAIIRFLFTGIRRRIDCSR